jgi:hypothetical protein
MRRFVASLTLLGATALGACSGGGTVLNFGNGATPDHVVITVQGTSNIARVLPGAGLSLSAVPVSGSQNGIININNFRWSAVATTGLSYAFDSLGDMRACGGLSQTIGAVTSPFLPDFGIYIAIDPTNEGNVILFPPTIVPAPAGSTVSVNYPYCVLVTAQAGKITGSGVGTTFTPIGTAGSVVVEVVNPQNPLQ